MRQGPFIFAEYTLMSNIILSILKMSSFAQMKVTGKEVEEEVELLLLSNTM
jgi:hypothetical protein